MARYRIETEAVIVADVEIDENDDVTQVYRTYGVTSSDGPQLCTADENGDYVAYIDSLPSGADMPASGIPVVVKPDQTVIVLEESSTAILADPMIVAAINDCLDARGSDVRIDDLTQEQWDKYLGPLVDEIEQSGAVA